MSAHIQGVRAYSPTLVNPEDWRQEAACRPGKPVDPDWFFPEKTNTAYNRELTAFAKGVCRSCPVLESCLAWALPRGESGTYGGMTEWERANLNRRTRSPRTPAIGNVALPREHGTARGYGQHQYLAEDPCRPCLDGKAAEHRARRRDQARSAKARAS